MTDGVNNIGGLMSFVCGNRRYLACRFSQSSGRTFNLVCVQIKASERAGKYRVETFRVVDLSLEMYI